MMMDSLDLLLGARVEWVSDNLTAETVKPRHIGQTVTFFYYDNAADEKSYEGLDIIGILEGSNGNSVIVSGDVYDESRMSGIKVWRRKIT